MDSLDEAMRRDREYFAAHPAATSYVRPALQGEAPRGVIASPRYVLVVQVRPGQRVRLAFDSLDGKPPRDVTALVAAILGGSHS